MKKEFNFYAKFLNNSVKIFKIIITGVSVIAFLTAISIGTPARAEQTIPSSCECKILLLPEHFEDYEAGARNFWAIIKKISRAKGLKTNLSKNEDVTERELNYIDTPDFMLYKTGYILRCRAEGKKFNYTFKYRNTDPLISAAAIVSPADEFKGKTSFEEDVVVKAESLEHIFSKSGKTDLKSEPAMTVKNFIKIFPGLAKFNFNAQATLKPVNDIIISEITFDYGDIYFEPKTKAKASFTIWYLKGNAKPLIAEFSYKYEIKNGTPDNDINFIHHASDRFLITLRSRIKTWLAAGQTKTGLIYKFDENFNK